MFSFSSLHLRMLYLVDAVEGGDLLIHAYKIALDFVPITKVVHDRKRDSEVCNSILYRNCIFSIRSNSVI